MKLFMIMAIVTLLTGFQNIAHAADDHISIGLGYYDLFGSDDGLNLKVEYKIAEPCFWEIKPFLAGHITSDGGLYALGGLYGDINLSPVWTLTPSLGAGLYHDGNGKDLGHTIQFRTQIELGYNFQNGSRLSGGLSHVSNAGLGSHNPGTEILSFSYSVPLQWFSSQE